jgi:hypothetical protein
MIALQSSPLKTYILKVRNEELNKQNPQKVCWHQIYTYLQFLHCFIRFYSPIITENTSQFTLVTVVEIRKIVVRGQPRQIVLRDPASKITTEK